MKVVDLKSFGHTEGSDPPRKRTFIFLLLVTCVVMVVISFALWWVPYVGLSNIHVSLPWVLAFFLGFGVLFCLGGALTLLMTIVRGRNLFFNRKIRGVVIRILFPLLVGVGRCFGLRKDEIRRSFIAINNRLVFAESKKVRPERLLILLPHCLQNHECGIRITADVAKCKGCGKCKIKDLSELSRRHGVSISVATGGTLARRIVIEKKPDMIIAVACERDLSSGIQDSYPIPVFGVLNQRPSGPCFDTDVDMKMVETALASFIYDAADHTERTGPRDAHESGASKRVSGPST